MQTGAHNTSCLYTRVEHVRWILLLELDSPRALGDLCIGVVYQVVSAFYGSSY